MVMGAAEPYKLTDGITVLALGKSWIYTLRGTELEKDMSCRGVVRTCVTHFMEL